MGITFDTPLLSLPGIGKKRAELFDNLGIRDVYDLLYHFPRAYQNRGKILDLAMTPDGVTGAFLLTVGTVPQTATLKGRLNLTKFSAFDETGKCTVTFFNQPYLKNSFHVGEEYRFWGRLTVRKGSRELSSPAYELAGPRKELPEIYPVYPLTEGLTQKGVMGLINLVLDEMERAPEGFPDPIPESILEKEGLCGLREAFLAIHRPKTTGMMEAARRRFVYEELYVFALSVSLTGKKIRSGHAKTMTLPDTDGFFKALPFEFTSAQKRSAGEIASDLCNAAGRPMSRLLSGDVGSGKTAVAAYAAYIAAKNGMQTSLMAPTEILARQHANDFSKLFAPLGIRVSLLTGSLSAAEKRKVKEDIKTGNTDVVIGTHALLTSDVEFASLGLVITDEQHRFGVRQRSILSERSRKKGFDPHVLVMSATPIPRTLALILYGDLDLSALDELPPGRQKVDTFLVDETYRDRLNGFIRKNAATGQVYIVCPSVEKIVENDPDNLTDDNLLPFFFEEEEPENEKPPLKSAVEYAEKLQNEIFRDLKVGLVHGKMKGSEKNDVMRRFEEGEIKILVSTTVIEVGVNVPKATLMIVENAERFGLSQLHQLRGRVGRGKAKSYCVLVSTGESEKAKKRLEMLCKTSDGFKIAEYDLTDRGPGDFMTDRDGSARQHGEMGFRFASLTDMDMLTKAFSDAKETLESGLLTEECFLHRVVERATSRMKE